MEGTTEPKELTKEEKYQKKIANLVPLKSTEGMTEEEKERQYQIRLKGGLARGKQMTKAKEMKEQVNVLLNTKISKEQAMNLLGDMGNLISEEDLNVQSLLIASALRESIENGNVRAMEFVRDTSGQKPKDDININADIVTSADRKLIENLRKRLNIGENAQENDDQ